MDFLSHDVADPQAVGALADLCFGANRQLRTASLLRRGAPRLESGSFVAVDKGELVGSVELHLLDWIAGPLSRPILILGPLATVPTRRCEKIGSRLMELALAEADRLGLAVMLIGDLPYYGRWGFSAEHTGKWLLPGPVDRQRLLLRAADPAAYAGPATLQAAGSRPEAAPIPA